MNTTSKMTQLWKKVRQEVPLVHNITNYVTVNDCANAILAVGGTPIMADDLREVCEIVRMAKVLVINMGTLNERTVESMIAAGKTANQLGIPVVFDPVGATASTFRKETTERILRDVKLSIIRGNLSELSFVAGQTTTGKGVDVQGVEHVDPVAVAHKVAEQYHCTAAVTGKIDVVSDAQRTIKIHNGHEQMAKVTGTGCMTTAITGAFQGCADDSYLAAVSAITAMGMAGEIAYEKCKSQGYGSFRVGLIDALSTIDADRIKEMARIEEL